MHSVLQTGKCWNEFQKDFPDKYFETLANKNILQIASMTQEELFNSPHVLLFGNEVTILKLYVHALLSKVFQKNVISKIAEFEYTNNSSKYTCNYKYSDVHLEIDMQEIISSERQFISDFIYKHIGNTRNIYQQKHIVVIHNIQSMTDATMFSLRRPLEQFSNNILFIVTTKSLSRIESAILSRFMYIKCRIEPDNLENFFEMFVSNKEIEGTIEIDPTDGLTHNLLSLSISETQDNIKNRLENFIDELLKEKNVSKACELIRSFGYKILHFNVPLATIMKITVNKLMNNKHFKNNIVEIVTLSANLEHKSLSLGKPILIFENYFLEIYKHI